MLDSSPLPVNCKRILLGIPTYDGTVSVGTLMATHAASRHHAVKVQPRTTSLLPKTFNLLWADAVLNAGTLYDYFVMLHADIQPEDWFVDKLVHIIERTQADVVSCVVPVKDGRRLTSTAMWLPDKLEPHYRLNYEDLAQLPSTFDGTDVTNAIGIQGKLVVNTGCWIARLNQPWNRKVHFQFESFIDWHWNDGTEAKVGIVPEDWDFSKQLHREGCKVLATQAVTLAHHGATAWTIWDMSGVG